MDKVVVLVGPTAVGKTEVSITLARKINGEIVSADSMQVYKGMDIGTSKVSSSQRREVPHHLIDILEPNAEYNAAEFRERASSLIPEIHARGRIPLVVGGSGLYVRALLDGLFPDKGADWQIRRKLYKQAEDKGSGCLYEQLMKVDTETASQIQPNDLRRIVRALEVYERTRIPISKLRKNTKGVSSEYEVEIFGLTRPRSELYRRIEERVDEMFERGLVNEVKNLVEKNRLGIAAGQALGYKELIAYLEGQYDLEEAKRRLKQNTRRFAKRQFTWFKRDKRIKWIEVDNKKSPEEITEMMLRCSISSP